MLAVATSLTGCAAGSLDSDGAAVVGDVTRRVCPAPIDYSDEFMARAAGEIEALPPAAAVREMIADYDAISAGLRRARAQ